MIVYLERHSLPQIYIYIYMYVCTTVEKRLIFDRKDILKALLEPKYIYICMTVEKRLIFDRKDILKALLEPKKDYGKEIEKKSGTKENLKQNKNYF